MRLSAHPMGVFPLAKIMERLRVCLGALLPEELTERKDDGDEVPSWYYGRTWVLAQQAPPRYVWHPADITPGAPFKGDAGEHTAEATGLEGILLYSWGFDDAQAWQLRHNALGQARKMYGADCVYQGCQYVEPADATYGFAYVTRLGFNVPVIGTTLAIARPTTIASGGVIIINGSETRSCGG